jgi:hypothetical protein
LPSNIKERDDEVKEIFVVFSCIHFQNVLSFNTEEGDDEVKEICVVFSCIPFQNVLLFLRYGSVCIYFAGPSHAWSAAGQNGCSITDVPVSP